MPNRCPAAPSVSGPSRWVGWLAAGVLAALVLTVFLPALDGDFLIWDDDTSIFENPHLGGLSAERVTWAFSDFRTSLRYMPLAWLGYSAIFHLGGLDPWHYHAANLLVHVVNSLLLLTALRRLLRLTMPGVADTQREMGAWLAAAIWALHPLRVEVVAWALTLTYGLAWCALLATLHCFLRAWESRRWTWRIATFAAFTVAMLTYPVGIAAWLGFLVLAFWMTRRLEPSRPREWHWVLILALPAIASAGLSLWARYHYSDVWSPPPTLAQFSLMQRGAQLAYTWAYYVWSQWWPIGLAPTYAALFKVDPGAIRFVLSGGFVLTGTVAAWIFRRRWPGLAAWWVATLVVLAPAMGLTEHPFITCDRYTGLAGLILAVAMAGVWVRISSRAGQQACAVAGCAALVACVGLTERQIPHWRNTETMFRYVLSISNHPWIQAECHLRLCLAAESTGQSEEAWRECQLGLTEMPNYQTLQMAANRLAARPTVPRSVAIQTELARRAADQGDARTSQAHLQRAVALDPRSIEPRIRLAFFLVENHQPRAALSHFLWAGSSGFPEADQWFLDRLEASATQIGDRSLLRAVRNQQQRRRTIGL